MKTEVVLLATRDQHRKNNKPDSERQIAYFLSFVDPTHLEIHKTLYVYIKLSCMYVSVSV